MEGPSLTLAGAALAAALLPRVDPKEAAPDFLRALRDGHKSARALLLNGEPVGAVQTVTGRNASLYVYILPDFRGRGLAGRAVSLLEAELRQAGAETAGTSYPAENRTAAAFAEKSGYRPRFRSDCMVCSGPALPPAPVPVRQYRDEDYSEAHAFYAEAFHRMRVSTGNFPDSVPESPSEAMRRYWAETAADRLVWVEDGALAAYAHLEGPEIGSVSVRPEMQGRGIGRKFVTYLISRLLSEGHREVSLWCVEGNVPARRLYDSLGFRETYRAAFARKIL